MSLPPLKTDPKYGYFPWWPEDGEDWIHPEDVESVRALIPSMRILRRDGERGDYVLMHYGQVVVRVRRTLWQEVEAPAFEMGDWVEVLTRGMKNERRTGVVREVFWDDEAREARYQISENGQPVAQVYAREDLKPVERPQVDAE